MILSMLESDEKSPDAKKALSMAWDAVNKLEGFDVNKS